VSDDAGVSDFVIVAVAGVTDIDRTFGVPLPPQAVRNAITSSATALSVQPLDFIRILPPQLTILKFLTEVGVPQKGVLWAERLE
jgi:hypothetical protein